MSKTSENNVQGLVEQQPAAQVEENTMLADNGNAGIQTNAGGLHEDTGLLDYCMLNKITIQAWSPLQYGMFEGSILDKEKYPELNEALERIAEVYNVTPSAIAAAWILRVPADIQVIAGTTNIEHLSDICKAAGVKLQRKEWYELYQKAGYKLP